MSATRWSRCSRATNSRSRKGTSPLSCAGRIRACDQPTWHRGALTKAALKFSLIPMIAIVIGALIAGWRTPGEKLVAAMPHLAAGVVFDAAATAILPLVMHAGSPTATLIGGAPSHAVLSGLHARD